LNSKTDLIKDGLKDVKRKIIKKKAKKIEQAMQPQLGQPFRPQYNFMLPGQEMHCPQPTENIQKVVQNYYITPPSISDLGHGYPPMYY
jgi:hypothetical protein